MVINKVLKKGDKIGSLNSAIDLKTIPLLGGKIKKDDVSFVLFLKKRLKLTKEEIKLKGSHS